MPDLEKRGLLASQAMYGSQKWLGLARIPEAEERVADRLTAITERKGSFRRLNIRLVMFWRMPNDDHKSNTS